MSKYGEALNKLKENAEMFDKIAKENNHSYKDDTVVEAYIYHSNTLDIEQILLKAQEQEKALEIIIKKQVDIEGFKEALGNAIFLQLETYNSWVNYDKDRMLTQEEFEFVEEVFSRD